MVDFDHLKTVVDNEGEVHAVIEEHDKELEMRWGQVDWCDGEDHFIVSTKEETRWIGKDRVVDFYVPQTIWH